MLRVAILGAGLQGTRRARAAVQVAADGSDIELVGIYDTDRAAATKLATAVGTRVLDDISDSRIDLVVVATPNVYHDEFARAALTWGQHVLCEKPLGFDGRGALELVELARTTGRMLRSGYHIRQYAAVQWVRDLLQRGRFGSLETVTVCYGSQRGPDFNGTWRSQPIMVGGGVLVDQGIHALDLVQWLTGTMMWVESVEEAVRTLSPDLEDDVLVCLRSATGVPIRVASSWTRWSARFVLEVVGTQGRVQLVGLGGKYGPQTADLNEDPRRVFGPVDVWAQEWRDILAELAGEHHAGGPGHEAVLLLDQAKTFQ